MPSTITKSIIQTNAQVISNENIIRDHKVLTCQAPEIASLAQPGHFVNALASGVIDSILRKPFSIFHADIEAGTISILYRVTGATTIGMSRKIPGDNLNIVGPLGGRIFHAEPADDIVHVMVGGGYGVPPLVFLAERLREASPNCGIRFIVGARTKDLLLCEADLVGIDIAAETTTEDGSHGLRGRVTDIVRQIVQQGESVRVYTCGPTAMMQAVAELCVAAHVPCQVSLEVPMPCGVGVCMGCVIDVADGRRVRACTDGPVFEAAEVMW